MKARQMIFDHPVGGTGLPAYGTDVLVNILNQSGGLPTRNWQDAYFPTADKTGGESLAAKQLIRKKGCFSCIISCGRVTKVDAPGYEGIGEGPEYETAWAYGADCGVDDLDAITKANYLCNEYGMDTIATGSTIACAMELFQRGIITTADTDGVDLSFGNAAAIVEMTRKAGEGEGFGAKLAHGLVPPGRQLRPPRVLHDRQEAGDAGLRRPRHPGHRPATTPPATAAAATCAGTPSPTRSCRAAGARTRTPPTRRPASASPSRTSRPRSTRPAPACSRPSASAARSSRRCCPRSPARTTRSRSSCTIGDRIWNQEKLWNIAAGFTKDDDTLPRRLLEEPIKSGASKGHVSKLGHMVPDYYAKRGWDENGVPTKAKLKELSLKA